MKNQLVSETTEVQSSGFFMPPPLATNEQAKTLAEWLTNLSLLGDTITTKTICVFRLFRTPDKNYVVYLAFAKHQENDSNSFDYISSVGNSFQLPGAETKSLTYDQVQAKVGDEYHTFSQKNRHTAEFFEKAESVNVTYDNYHILKLHGN